ncbi:hypothetical protein T310_3694 [Rasamsonia emersonii CBS 393.64]|uniref:Uncharacterized protein n=1 Tax=Rasamsonia emersonii (strain ATCC 16479 / CBS 393.64 / IMI 116815) TaxID=1408163 RepID=A0A0F4YVJ9_RASE3|nr:hypothetical protein T310_3694 [Rasamsonia emersonii CBS 393.64]KKA22259.1 hypothetical protein T310_3694 [Rasamsonia emersonii CBS 393.64]
MEGHAKYSCHVTGILSSMPAPEFEWYSTEEDDANRRLGRFQAFMRIEYGVLRSHSYNLGLSLSQVIFIGIEHMAETLLDDILLVSFCRQLAIGYVSGQRYRAVRHGCDCSNITSTRLLAQ